MQRPRQEAQDTVGGMPPVGVEAARQLGGAGRMDADGWLAAPSSGGQLSYAGLFSEEERSRGLPAELMRLARRHGCVRDRVFRSDGKGDSRMMRIALQSVHDDDGRVIGFVETLEGSD